MRATPEHPWQKLTPRRITDSVTREDPILGGMTDGLPHRRIREGYCITCGVVDGAHHRAVEPGRRPDTPIYDRLRAAVIARRDHALFLYLLGLESTPHQETP